MPGKTTIEKNFESSLELALQSKMAARLGSIIVMNGKVVGQGINNARTRYGMDAGIQMDSDIYAGCGHANCASMHAEMAALHSCKSLRKSLISTKAQYREKPRPQQDTRKI